MKRAAQIVCPDCMGELSHVVIPRSFDRPRAKHVLQCKNPGCAARYPALASGKPRGVLANSAIRRARMDCESVFDPLWREAVNLYDIEETNAAARAEVEMRIRTTAKSRTTRFIAFHLGLTPSQAKLENITDLHVLKKFWHVANNASAEQIRDWAKAQKEPADG